MKKSINQIFKLLVFVLMLTHILPAKPLRIEQKPEKLPPVLISEDFLNVSRSEALRKVALASGKELYYDQYLGGTISISFRETPIELAISHILVDRPFHSWRIERIRDETSAIFVSSGLPTLLRRDFPATRDGRFISEFIVDEGAAQWVKDILAGEYPNVFFTIMLNPSALKVEGTQEEVAQVARELSYGQSYRIFGLPDADFLLPVRYAELDVVKESIENLIPELELRVVDNYRLLFAVGPREAIAAARGLLLELDRPTEVE